MVKDPQEWTVIGPTRSVTSARFESEDDVARLQHELLKFLKRTGVHDDLCAQVFTCGLHYCGADRCIEACWFGTRQRRLWEISRACRLFCHLGEPVFEVRISRAAWAQPMGLLRFAKLTWAKIFLRRALDNLYQPDIVAVGMLKPYIAGDGQRRYWRCEIHCLVAGADKDDLQKAIPKEKDHTEFDIIDSRIMPVANLGQAVSRVLKRDLQVWQHPWHANLSGATPSKAERMEFNDWLLGLPLNARLFRYGCNASFQKLPKQPRQIRVRKKRPNPYWLEPWQYGNHPQYCKCGACTGMSR
jgi:hypothetical protein